MVFVMEVQGLLVCVCVCVCVSVCVCVCVRCYVLIFGVVCNSDNSLEHTL